jgi:hypothetical protein
LSTAFPATELARERLVFSGLGTQEIRKGLALACRNAKIAHYSPHDLRHRRTSLWLAHGFDPITVKEWCGHSRASMTLDVYAHVVTDPGTDEWRGGSGSMRTTVAGVRRPPSALPVWSRCGLEARPPIDPPAKRRAAHFKKASGERW